MVRLGLAAMSAEDPAAASSDFEAGTLGAGRAGGDAGSSHGDGEAVAQRARETIEAAESTLRGAADATLDLSSATEPRGEASAPAVALTSVTGQAHRSEPFRIEDSPEAPALDDRSDALSRVLDREQGEESREQTSEGEATSRGRESSLPSTGVARPLEGESAHSSRQPDFRTGTAEDAQPVDASVTFPRQGGQNDMAPGASLSDEAGDTRKPSSAEGSAPDASTTFAVDGTWHEEGKSSPSLPVASLEHEASEADASAQPSPAEGVALPAEVAFKVSASESHEEGPEGSLAVTHSAGIISEEADSHTDPGTASVESLAQDHHSDEACEGDGAAQSEGTKPDDGSGVLPPQSDGEQATLTSAAPQNLSDRGHSTEVFADEAVEVSAIEKGPEGSTAFPGTENENGAASIADDTSSKGTGSHESTCRAEAEGVRPEDASEPQGADEGGVSEARASTEGTSEAAQSTSPDDASGAAQAVGGTSQDSQDAKASQEVSGAAEGAPSESFASLEAAGEAQDGGSAEPTLDALNTVQGSVNEAVLPSRQGSAGEAPSVVVADALDTETVSSGAKELLPEQSTTTSPAIDADSPQAESVEGAASPVGLSSADPDPARPGSAESNSGNSHMDSSSSTSDKGSDPDLPGAETGTRSSASYLPLPHPPAGVTKLKQGALASASAADKGSVEASTKAHNADSKAQLDTTGGTKGVAPGVAGGKENKREVELPAALSSTSSVSADSNTTSSSTMTTTTATTTGTSTSHASSSSGDGSSGAVTSRGINGLKESGESSKASSSGSSTGEPAPSTAASASAKVPGKASKGKGKHSVNFDMSAVVQPKAASKSQAQQLGGTERGGKSGIEGLEVPLKKGPHWDVASARAEELIQLIQPNQKAEERRMAVSEFVAGIVTQSCDCQVRHHNPPLQACFFVRV